MRVPLTRKQFLKSYRKTLAKTDKKMFAFLFNIRSFLFGSPARVRWNGERFEVNDIFLPNIKRYFRHQKPAAKAYEHGLVQRAELIHKAYFLDKINIQNGDTFIDCGANVGDLKLWFDINNIDIDYIGFEPSPVEYECLKMNVVPKTAHNMGLWFEEGTLRFYVCSQESDSSLIEPAEYDSVKDVQVKRLDNFVDGRVKCLKLEAEGAEPEVLRGLSDSALKNIDYIAADLGYERGVTSESTLVPVVNYLLQRGFKLIDVSHNRICALFKNTSLDD